MKPALPGLRASLQKLCYRVQKEIDFGFADDVRRHPVDGSAQRAEQYARLDGASIEIPTESRFGFPHVEGPDHSRVAEVRDASVRAQALGAPVEGGRRVSVALQHLFFLQDVEHGQGGAAGKRVAAVGMRVQETPLELVVVESLVDAIGRQHHRERKVAAGETLGEAQEVWSDSRLLASEQGSGAPESDRDLVGDEMDVEAIAKLAAAPQVFRVVHVHP